MFSPAMAALIVALTGLTCGLTLAAIAYAIVRVENYLRPLKEKVPMEETEMQMLLRVARDIRNPKSVRSAAVTQLRILERAAGVLVPQKVT